MRAAKTALAAAVRRSAALLDQAVSSPDALRGAMRNRQIEFTDQAAPLEGRQSFAQMDQLRLHSRRCFLRLMMTCPGLFHQAQVAALLITAQPIADGACRGGKQLRDVFDAALFSTLYQSQEMVIGIAQLTYQIKITGGGNHDRQISCGPRRPAEGEEPGGAAPTKCKSRSFQRFSLTHFNLTRCIRCE